MKKVEYINEMPYIHHGKNRAPYRIEGAKGDCNHGNLLESMVKYHLGLEHIINPNISGMEGFDVPELRAEVKSSEAGLGRDIGERDFSVSQQIRFYFDHAPKGKTWIWVEFDEDTQKVTEYHMNKREFGYFLTISLRKKQHKQSNGKSINVRFKKTTKEMIAWLESQA